MVVPSSRDPGGSAGQQGENMDAEKKVTSCHQRPADRAPFEIADRDANAVREGAGSVQHGQALQPPSRRKRHKRDREPDDREPATTKTSKRQNREREGKNVE